MPDSNFLNCVQDCELRRVVRAGYRARKGSYRLNGKVLEVVVQGGPRAAFEANREGRTVLIERCGKNKVSGFSKLEY